MSTPPPPRSRARRTTRRSVVWIDRAAGTLIRAGGAGIIVAVFGIFAYLLWVVWPLFAGADVAPAAGYPLLEPAEAERLLFAEVDEYRVAGAWLLRSGELGAFQAATGATLERRPLVPPEPALTAYRRAPDGRTALGFADGSVRIARIGFDTGFIGDDEVTPALAALAPGATLAGGPSVVERTGSGELRRVTVTATVDEPIPAARGAVRLLDYRPGDAGSQLAVLTADGSLVVSEVSERRNLLTGEVTSELSSLDVPYPPELAGREPGPRFLLLGSAGDQLYLAWADGELLRYDLRDPAAPAPVEHVDIVADPAARLTAFRFALGEQTLLAGTSDGRVTGWFRVHRDPEAAALVPDRLPLPDVTGLAGDEYVMVPAHRFRPQPGELVRIAVSQRDKTFLTGGSEGRLLLRHLTSERTLADVALDPPVPAAAAQIAPKGDGLFAVGADGRARLWRVSSPHPETTLGTLFGKVWYEGFPEPSYTWQSSSGTDDFEPKLSLVPLVFGTLKATLYSMLFAVPIALAAAIYTSEFLDRRYRTPLKSSIEIMASLPSVVLGFIAALVLAPVVESWVVAVLTAFAVIPVAVLAFGYAWQLLPRRTALALEGRGPIQMALLLALVAGAIAAAALAAPLLERLLFSGDFKAWLDGRAGGPAPGIAVLAWPVAVVALLLADRIYLVPAVGRRLGHVARGRAAGLELARFALLLAASLALAAAAGVTLAALGWDPRGDLVGTYVQRNALVVGFVMGFAVIPIVYTISDDALNAVPQTLRSASLACGATRWQTATRVVVPVAASGIFSALMIGLGRAVGETMIVLMAAGNTPVLSLNVFNGLRTLSANIAVELPEAVKDGTLYRTLFLAALTLFLVTFLVNTVAEVVRQRFRRRAFQL